LICLKINFFNLGTFITEFEGGEKLCEKIFSSQEVIDELIEKMIQLCINLNFEGWLINIENIMKVKFGAWIFFIYSTFIVQGGAKKVPLCHFFHEFWI
jgi:hypothetical protein